MPMYLYKCPTCARKREVLLKLAELDTAVVLCPQDNFPMNRQICAPAVVGDYAPYECPVTGKMIEGRKAHQENLARTGCRILEPGETDAHRRSLAQADVDLDNRVEATVDEFIAKLPGDKRDKLAAEMDGGLTTELARSSL